MLKNRLFSITYGPFLSLKVRPDSGDKPYGSTMGCKILDFVGKRNERIEQKRRSFERVVFQNFPGARAVVDLGGIDLPIELVDISPKGCLFKAPQKRRYGGKFKKGDEISLRIYFTEESYVAVAADIKHSRKSTDPDGQIYVHYGCAFDTSLPSFQAMEKFIEFLYSFAEHSSLDKHSVKFASL